MASFEKRVNSKGETSYRVKIRIKGYPVETATFTRLTDARSWANTTEEKMKNGKYISESNSKKYTVSDIIDKYRKIILVHKETVKKDWEPHLRWWDNKIGNYTLNKVTPALLSDIRDILIDEPGNQGKMRSNSTVNRYMATLQCVFSAAVNEWELLEINPFLKVKKLPEPKGRVRYLSNEERIRLLEECQKAANPYLYPAVITALSTGARRNEILTLKWQDVFLDEEVAYVQHTKNGDRKALNLQGIVKEQFQHLHDIRRPNDIYVFPSMDGKKPFDIVRSWKKAVKDAGIEDFRFHDLRHTTASYMAMNGKSSVEIADILGHKTLQMVKRYSHFSNNHRKSITNEINNLMFGEE